MDMKKKLEGAYNPDKQGRKEKIIIGLSGGIDSFVMAYLLKIQKYDLIAVTIANTWDDLKSDQAKVLSCHITEPKIEKIKDFCLRLGIPLHILKPTSEFKEEVIDRWVSDKIQGRFSKPCLNCHELRMKILFQKMEELGAKSLATGHYAKIFHHEAHDTVYVHTSNDEEHDQSAYLSRLPHKILNSLLLPLSDLGKKEVLKLAENFGLQEEDKPVKFNECLAPSEEIFTILEAKIPPKLRKEGEIMSLDGIDSLGPHAGVHRYSRGASLEFKSLGKSINRYFGAYSYVEKKILVVNEDYYVRDRLMVVNVKFAEEMSWLEPVRGVILSYDKAVECWIHPKSLSSVYLELAEPTFLKEGDMISLSKKKGKNAKVYLTGEIQFLPLEPVVLEGERSVPKADHTRHY